MLLQMVLFLTGFNLFCGFLMVLCIFISFVLAVFIGML